MTRNVLPDYLAEIPRVRAELRHVRDPARRLAALRLMAPELDANYRACAAAHRPLAAPS